MPTVFRSGPYRFFFFSNDADEPVHIHVESGDKYAKFWINPVQLAMSVGFSAHEINRIRRMVADNAGLIKEKWDEHFGG